jgi:hypothetical protein
MNKLLAILALATSYTIGCQTGDWILAMSPPPSTPQLIVLLSLTVFAVMAVAVVLLCKFLPEDDLKEVIYEQANTNSIGRIHRSGMRAYSGIQ